MVEHSPDKTGVGGSIPPWPTPGAHSSVVERFVDIEEVGGSIPPAPTSSGRRVVKVTGSIPVTPTENLMG